MTVSFELIKERQTLEITGQLDRFNLGHKKLYQFPKYNANDLTIDLIKVDSLDTAGLAWLLKLVAYYQSTNITTTILNAPKQLIALAEISNVLKLLPLVEHNN